MHICGRLRLLLLLSDLVLPLYGSGIDYFSFSAFPCRPLLFLLPIFPEPLRVTVTPTAVGTTVHVIAET